MRNIITLGVYGFDECAFFQTIRAAEVDVFCDIRLRRGMRGRTYAFANATYLQHALADLGVRYLHLKALAPPQAIRDLQRQEDMVTGVKKRTRQQLSPSFIAAYTQHCRSTLATVDLCAAIGPESRTIALFCVERDPQACHRSIAASHLAQRLGLPIEDKVP